MQVTNLEDIELPKNNNKNKLKSRMDPKKILEHANRDNLKIRKDFTIRPEIWEEFLSNIGRIPYSKVLTSLIIDFNEASKKLKHKSAA